LTRFVLLCFFAALGLASPVALAQAVSARDDRGYVIALPAPASRIVSLAPHVTELLFEAGAGGKLIGVSRFSDHPEAAQGIASVGDAAAADLERIVALRPNLVVAWKSGNHLGDIAKLERLGYPVFVTEPSQLSDIPRLLRALGTLAGTSAEQPASAFESELEDLAARYQGRPKVSVFYEIWNEPLMTVNRGHMIDHVLRLCGGVNIFAGARTLVPVVSVESVLANNPDVIIDGYSWDATETALAAWQRFPGLNAVRNRQLYRVPPELLHRQAPRILRGAGLICEYLEKARK
jgi:iron complex transport system substrate-binding protein